MNKNFKKIKNVRTVRVTPRSRRQRAGDGTEPLVGRGKPQHGRDHVPFLKHSDEITVS
jgi:hypothetical protein